MKRIFLSYVLCGLTVGTGLAGAAQEWPQWGQNARHTGTSTAVGQTASRIIDSLVYDPFVPQEQADPLAAPDLLVHYQAPLIDGNDVYMEFKTGTYTSLSTWETQTWNEKKLHWQAGHLSTVWAFASDWKPAPFSIYATGPFWEPVFHGVLAGSFVYVPGAGGTIFKLNKSNGSQVARINPFGGIDPDTFTAGPLTADSSGNIYYNVLELVHGQAWHADVVNSWLVKVSPAGSIQKATYASLTPGAPGGNDKCQDAFNVNQLPWPPAPDAVAPTTKCGSQRPALNQAVAVGPDGTIYTVSQPHLVTRNGYLLAVNPNLTPKWQASLSERFNDGCGVYLPPNGTPGGCRAGANIGVDPSTNRPGTGRVIDDSTASVVVLPDGSLLYGAYTRYDWFQGHLMKFSSTGQFLASYPFGWDTTPSVRSHDGTYSIVFKDNHYSDGGSYCNDDTLCPPDRTASNPSNPEQYFITSLSPNLNVEWQWRNTNTLSCSRGPNGQVTCQSDHPNGFEWCVNAAVVDSTGTTYANSEDGNIYVINPNGTLRENLFLNLAIGAAYTPLSMSSDGKIFTQNDGILFVVGN
jgi:hypothetical protein